MIALQPLRAARLLALAFRGCYSPDQARDGAGRWTAGDSERTIGALRKSYASSALASGRGFLLPDGSFLNFASQEDTHKAAAGKAGLRLEDVLKSGVVRFSVDSADMAGRITEHQASALHDAGVEYFEAFDPATWEGVGSHDGGAFGNADALRRWVNSHYRGLAFRGAAFDPEQPRDDKGQWTALGESLKASINYHSGVFYTTKRDAEDIADKIPGSIVLKKNRGFVVSHVKHGLFGPEGFKALAAAKYPIRQIADAAEPRISIAVRYAMHLASSQADPRAGVDVMAAALGRALPKILARCCGAAASAAAGMVPGLRDAAEHSYASVQINLPDEPFLSLGATVADEDLADSGRETHPHVTVKWGLHGDDPEEVRALLDGAAPIDFSFGNINHFPGDGFDVVYVEAISPRLAALNARITEALPSEQTHEYVPHVTLAYVKPGLGAGYDGPAGVPAIRVTELVFSDTGGNRYSIALNGDVWRVAEFDESQHPRDEEGKFTATGDALWQLTRESGKEHAIALDAAGAELGRLTGDDHSVGLPKMSKGQIFSSHHTHPFEASLSLGDIILLANTPLMSEEFAHGPEYTYRAERISGKDRELYFAAKDVFPKHHVAAIDRFLKHNDLELFRRESRASQHDAMQELHDRGLVKYSRTRRGLRALKTKPRAFRFAAADPEATAWAREHAGILIKDISETTRRRIRSAVAEFKNSQESYEAIRAILHDPERAALIARTESMIAAHAGQRMAWQRAQEEGYLSAKATVTWIATDDEAECPQCEGLDGEEARIGMAFSDGTAFPPAHPRCRCTLELA